MKNFYQKGFTQTLTFKKRKKLVSGFTLLEATIVIAIIIIMVLIVSPQFSKIRNMQTLKSAGGDIVSALNQAQSQTRASLNSSNYGVHFQSNQIIIFKGTVFSSGDSNNKTISIISPATISNVTLNNVSGTTGDVYFNRLTGLPNVTGTVTVSIPNNASLTKTITLSATGEASTN